MIYKVSYVVNDMSHPGAIINETAMPQPGNRVTLGDHVFEIIEVVEMMPARGDFQFLHVTVKPIKADDAQ